MATLPTTRLLPLRSGHGSLWQRWLNTPAPSLALEIGDQALVAARLNAGRGEGALQTSVRALPAGLLTPALTETNIADPAELTARLRGLLESVGGLQREVMLLLPDLAVRLSLLDFEEVPGKPEELQKLVRFRLRKTMPVEGEQLSLSCEVIGADKNQKQYRVLALMALSERIAEYEECVLAAGARPSWVWPAGLACLGASAALDHAALLLRAFGGSLTALFAWRGVPQLYRVMPLEPGASLDFDELYPSIAFFHDFWLEHQVETVPGQPIDPALAGGTPHVFTAGLADALVHHMAEELPWANVHPVLLASEGADAQAATATLAVTGAVAAGAAGVLR